MKRVKHLKQYGKLMVLSLAALGLVAVSGGQDSMAYFTTYVTAGGSEIVRLGAQTEIREDVSSMTKHVSIQNVSQTNDCFVRVKAFCGQDLTLTYTDTSGRGDWYDGKDGYWYYRPIVPAGAATAVLDIKINLPAGFNKDEFNVVVIQECTPVLYDDSGKASADWSKTFTDYKETGGKN